MELPADGSQDAVPGQIGRAPLRRGGGPQDEVVRAGAVGDQLRGSDRGEIGVARIGDFNREMHRTDGVEARENEGELGFGDPHLVALQREDGSALDDTLGDQPAGERTVDADVRLAGEARRGDLPSEQRAGTHRFDQRLDRIAFGARDRS